MENGPFVDDYQLKLVIFHSYVKLPEGKLNCEQWFVLIVYVQPFRLRKMPYPQRNQFFDLGSLAPCVCFSNIKESQPRTT
jgi:hypothetical protein